jgi:hypothetical protein
VQIQVPTRGENENFRETKFQEISRKFAHFRIIFAFRKNGKNRFRFNPSSYLAVAPFSAPLASSEHVIFSAQACIARLS